MSLEATIHSSPGCLGVSDRFAQLLIIAGVNFAVWIGESLTQYAASVMWRNLAQTLEHEIRRETYGHVQNLELAWFEDRSTGGLMSILNDDINQLERFLDTGAMEVIRTTVNVIFVGAVFFGATTVLGLMAFLPIPLVVVGSIFFQRRLSPLYTPRP